MNEERRRFLVEYFGGCWHESDLRHTDFRCKKCKETFPNLQGWFVPVEGLNMNFHSWPGFGWLKEKLVEKGLWPEFFLWAWGKWIKMNGTLSHVPDFVSWLIDPDRMADLGYEFLKKVEPKPFQEATEAFLKRLREKLEGMPKSTWLRGQKVVCAYCQMSIGALLRLDAKRPMPILRLGPRRMWLTSTLLMDEWLRSIIQA